MHELSQRIKLLFEILPASSEPGSGVQALPRYYITQLTTDFAIAAKYAKRIRVHILHSCIFYLTYHYTPMLHITQSSLLIAFEWLQASLWFVHIVYSRMRASLSML